MLDEPTAGMSPDRSHGHGQADPPDQAERGVTVIMTEHDMDVIFGLADRLMVMNYGEMIAVGRRPRFAPTRRFARCISAKKHPHA